MATHSSTQYQGWRSLVGCSPWGHKELDTTEPLHFHFSLSCIGEGSGNPLRCSCLENPRDGGAWWAAVCGVTQSWTRLKQLSSSSISSSKFSKSVRPRELTCFLLCDCLKSVISNIMLSDILNLEQPNNYIIKIPLIT